jgi:DNA repair exonuclease SbcCD ATPase subunit
MSDTYRILRLDIQNYLGIKAASIPCKGPVTVIAGPNGAGKTCVLNAIKSALGGAKAAPADPIRHGAKSAQVVVDLGAIRVEEVYDKRRGRTLVVKDAHGKPQKAGQTLLNELFDAATFDAMSFARKSPKERVAILQKLTGVDLSALEAQRKATYDQRTNVNHTITNRKELLRQCAEHKDVPEREVSVAELMAELQRREAMIKENEKVRATVTAADKPRQAALTEAGQVGNEIVECEEQIAEWQARLKELLAKRKQCAEKISATETEYQARNTAARALVDPDLDEVRQQIADSETVNRKVRENQERVKLATDLAEREAESERLTEELRQLDEQKLAAIASAKLPVEGLSFDSEDVSFHSVPFDQIATSDKLRIGVAIWTALNPKLRVMLSDDGDDLDDERLALLTEICRKHDLWAWITRWAGGPDAVVIEDGEVKA